MRWPWVSRAHHHEVREAWFQARNDLSAAHSALRDERARYADLLAKYHEIKMQGGGAPAPAPQPLPRTKATPVDEVIGTVAGSNSRLRKQLKDFAIQQRFAGADDAEIAHALLNWDEDDSGVPE